MTSWSLEVQGLPRCCHGDNYLSRGEVTRPEQMLIHRRIWCVVVFSLLTPGQGLDITSLSYCVCLCTSIHVLVLYVPAIHSLRASSFDLLLHEYVTSVLSWCSFLFISPGRGRHVEADVGRGRLMQREAEAGRGKGSLAVTALILRWFKGLLHCPQGKSHPSLFYLSSLSFSLRLCWW